LLFEFIDQIKPTLWSAFADNRSQRVNPFFGFHRIGVNAVVSSARAAVQALTQCTIPFAEFNRRGPDIDPCTGVSAARVR
jgi:hypothetical protein